MARPTNASAAAARARTGFATRGRILEAARELFAAHGFDRTSMRAIARRLDLTDPALYYHFHSKRELLEALVHETSTAARIPKPPGLRMQQDEVAELVLENFFAWLGEHELIRVLLRQQLLNDPSSIEFRRQATEAFFQLIGPPLHEIYGGPNATLLLHSLNMLLCGALWDAMLAEVDIFTNAAAYDAFEQQVRQLVHLVLGPHPCGDGRPA